MTMTKTPEEIIRLKEFTERLAADSAFAEHYRGLTSQAAVVQQAQKDGYAVTADDLAELLQAARDGQIGDEELDSVTGGWALDLVLNTSPTGRRRRRAVIGCPTCGTSIFQPPAPPPGI